MGRITNIPVTLGEPAIILWLLVGGAMNQLLFDGYQLSHDHRLRWRRPGAASSAEQPRLEIHRSIRRRPAIVEEHRRRMGVEDRVASRLRYMESESASTARVSLPTVSRGRELKFDVGFVLAIPERSLRRRRRRVPYRCGLPRFGDYFRIARQSGLGGTTHVRCHVFGRPRGVVIHSARSASTGLTAAARRAGR